MVLVKEQAHRSTEVYVFQKLLSKATFTILQSPITEVCHLQQRTDSEVMFGEKSQPQKDKHCLISECKNKLMNETKKGNRLTEKLVVTTGKRE